MVSALIAVILAQAASPTIDELIPRLASESPEVRDKTTGEIQIRWKTWTPADLDKLRKHAESKDAEVATRVKKSLELIALYRSIPDETWRELPEAGPTLLRNEPGPLGMLLRSMIAKWWEGGLSSHAAAPVALHLLDDHRESEEEFMTRDGGRVKYDVSHLAHSLLGDLVPHAGPWSPEEWRSWWKKNQSKSEKEWSLAGLDEENDLRRASAIVRLSQLKDPSVYPRLFETLKGIESYYSFERALSGLRTLPADVLHPAMKPYLADRRLSWRYEAARILLKAMPREAVDSVIEGVALSEIEYRSRVFDPSLFDILSWLVGTKDDRALAFLCRSMTQGPLDLKLDTINVGYKVDDSQIEKALVQAFDDPEQRIDPHPWPVQLDNPRVCDLAAHRIACRMGIDKEFMWPESVRARDRVIEEIRNRWRKTKGLPPIPFHGPGIVLVSADKMDALIPELTHADADRRRAGIRRLSELGPGAWSPLHERIAKAEPQERVRLEEAATSWSNALRRVTAGNEEARPFAEALAKRLHDPFDVDAFLKEVPETWFDRPELNGMEIRIFRGADGRGIFLDVKVAKACEESTDYNYFKVEAGIAGYVMKWDRSVFRKILRKEIQVLTEAMKESPERQVNLAWQIRKWKGE